MSDSGLPPRAVALIARLSRQNSTARACRRFVPRRAVDAACRGTRTAEATSPAGRTAFTARKRLATASSPARDASSLATPHHPAAARTTPFGSPRSVPPARSWQAAGCDRANQDRAGLLGARPRLRRSVPRETNQARPRLTRRRGASRAMRATHREQAPGCCCSRSRDLTLRRCGVRVAGFIFSSRDHVDERPCPDPGPLSYRLHRSSALSSVGTTHPPAYRNCHMAQSFTTPILRPFAHPLPACA